MLHDFEPSPHHPVSEPEAFAGEILGRQSGAQSKLLREQGKAMRERFGTIVEYAVLRITKGDDAMRDAEELDDLYDLYDTYDTYDEREVEALPRAIACLENSVQEKGYVDRRLGELKSWRYVAAAVALREAERYLVTTFGSRVGLSAL